VNPLSATIAIPAPAQPFLTATEVGRVLGRDAKTIRRWAKEGLHDFPCPITFAGDLVWPARVVAIWLAWQEIKPQSQAAQKDELATDSE
jgi:predicted DNA-binding transcriptional regulator AlpA